MFSSINEQYRRFRSMRKIRRERPEVWLLKEKKIGYVQIPKVATRSIRAALAKQILEEQGINVGYDELDSQKIKEVESYSTVRLERTKMNSLRDEYFVFSFIRNPYDRLYSCYKNKVLAPLTNNKRNVLAKHGIELGISFEEFVERVAAIPDTQADRHIRSQNWFVSNKGELTVDFLGRLDEFEVDWTMLSDRFQLPTPPVRNTSFREGNQVVSPYNARTLSLVQNRYARDIELYESVDTGTNK